MPDTAERLPRRCVWRPHRRSVSCAWCGKRWSVSDIDGSTEGVAEAEIWIGEDGTVLCPDCYRPIDFGSGDG